MVRKKFDRTVVKKCSQCEEQVPVACKFCTCGHQFATRNKILLREEAVEAMGLLDDESTTNTDAPTTTDTKEGTGDDNNTPSVPESRKRPRRLTRERPNYYVITPELNRHVKKKGRHQRERGGRGCGSGVGSSSSGLDNTNNNNTKKKKRGRPRGSVSSNTAGTRTRSKTRKLDHYSSSSSQLHIKKEDFNSDTKNSISSSSSLNYGDKPLTNVTVSICTAPNNSCCTNLSNCNITKHHYGSNNYSSGGSDGGANHGGSSSGGKDSNHHRTNGHLNNNSHLKNQATNDYCTTGNFNNNNSYNNYNSKDGGEKDAYASMSFEKAMKFYAILADLNRKITSQSFKPW